MTQEEKLTMLKHTIQKLYEQEGRSISYIANLLEIDRHTLSKQLRAWNFVQANSRHLSASQVKFANRHKQEIASMLQNDVPIYRIAEKYKVSTSYIGKVIAGVKELDELHWMHITRRNPAAQAAPEDRSAVIVDAGNETWKPLLGYDGYFVSSMGRVKSCLNGRERMLRQTPNVKSGRLYVCVVGPGGRKNLQVARLVAFTFLGAPADKRMTVDHKDGNVRNNTVDNLEWTTQSENNRRAFQNGRTRPIAHSRHGYFKAIRVDGRYEFKTVAALARFLNVSETQAKRYVENECSCSHSIELLY